MSKKRIAIIATAILICTTSVATAGSVAESEANAESTLPVTEVVLYNTGVGYFQRSGTITDTQTIDLVFDSASVNDLLKSLVISDLDGGTISWVNYASREPVLQSIQALSVNLAANPPFLQILAQLRGERVLLDFENGGRIVGSIVGIEQTGADVRINILDDRERIRSISAADVQAFRSEDPMVREELERALVLLAESKYKDAKRVSIRFTGEGTRRVQLGYVLPTPVWKASYRLVVGEDEHVFQAWAIVENMTREDWSEVSVALISGLPISFEMDLYRPIHIRRPNVEVDVAKSVAPPTYEESARLMPESLPKSFDTMSAAPRASSGFAMSGMGADDEGDGVGSFDIGSGVESAAVGASSGEYFQYQISSPITLSRSESGMVPIASSAIGGSKLSIFNAATHPTHPLHSFRIENTTNLDFVGGPVTVFESGAYAGDSQLGVLRAGEDRLISYAIDLSSIINVRHTADPERLTSASILEGVLETEERSERRTIYQIMWKHDDERHLLIEQPISRGWNIIDPAKADEKTDSYYRFIFDPVDSPEFRVAEERIRKNLFDLENASDGTIRRYAENDEVPVAVRNALEGILTRKADITDVVQLIRAHENRRNEIFRDQQRIRENLSKVAEDSEIYTRYLEQLGSQEDELEIIARNIQTHSENVLRLRDALADYIHNLQAE